ncbi:MAG: ATP-binding protein [Clostridia bacterium]|nr:ATP-binding protein [Clostridia bacterium]
MDTTAIFLSLEKRAAQSIKQEEGDYEKDGLLHCGKCNTPKQCCVEVFGAIRKPPCLCKCAKEAREKEEEERRQRELAMQVQRYRRTGFPDSEMENWNFSRDDGSDPKMTAAMQNYVKNFATFREQGKGLLLFGDVGTGKTFRAACVANALIDAGVPALVTNFARIRNTVQGLFEGRQEYFDSLNKFPLLVIDDLSTESKTEYMQEIVYNVIDGRYRAKLPLIVTTNLTREELMNPADITYQRIFSRLFEMCTPIEIAGADRRHAALKNDIAATKQLLGL